MPIIVAPRRRPVMTGLVVGGAVANRRRQQRQNAQMQQEVAMANQRAADAQMQAELARKDVQHQSELQKQQQMMQSAAQPVAVAAAPAGMTPVTVVVPAGVGPGQAFNIHHNGQAFTITCPANVSAGQSLTVNLPASVAVASATPAVAAPAAAPAAPLVPQTLQRQPSSGKELFRSAMLDTPAPSAPPPTAMGSNSDLVLVSDHHVDENSPQMKQFGIISLSKGTLVTLVEGDLVNGLGGAFKDYVKVTVPAQGGRFGMISRLVVQQAAPPPAVAAPPPALGL